MDNALYLVNQAKSLRKVIRILEDEAPPGLDSEIDNLTEKLREVETDLRRERIKGLSAIADDLYTAANRLQATIRLDDLGDGTALSDMDLSSLGTLFGHFDRAWDEIPDEWKVA